MRFPQTNKGDRTGVPWLYSQIVIGVRVRHRGLMQLLMVFPERRVADCCANAAVRVRRILPLNALRVLCFYAIANGARWDLRASAGLARKRVAQRYGWCGQGLQGQSLHLMVNIDEKVIECGDVNKAETRKFQIGDEVEREGQGGGKRDHMNRTARFSCGHAEASEQ